MSEKQEMMRYNLRDVTFLLLIRLDSIERLENLAACISVLSDRFDTQINVWECASYNNGFVEQTLKGKGKCTYTYREDCDRILYRTKYLNMMMREVTTPYVSVWDADVIVHEKQIIDAAELLRKGEADFVYPYSEYFLETTSILRNIFLQSNNDIDFLTRNRKRMKPLYYPHPVGGAFFCNVKSYIKSGLENEQFYGWGVEDGERYNRWKNKGYIIKRIEGPLFHLSHPRASNSWFQHPDQKTAKLRLVCSSIRTHEHDIFQNYEYPPAK